MKRFNSRHLSSMVMAFLVLCALSVPFIPLGDAADTVISVEPPSVTGLLPGASFGVGIRITDAVNVHAWEVKLAFENDVLNATDATEGPFLKAGGPTLPFNVYIDNTAGYVMCGCAGTDEHYGIGGDGFLAYVEFEILGGGESLLDLYDTKLLNRDQDPLPHMVEDGEFQGEAPYADFTVSPQYAPAVNQTVTFNASDSYDPDGTIESYHWDWDDGSTDDTSNPLIEHVFTEPSDEYSVNLTVTDNEGYEDFKVWSLAVIVRDIAVTHLEVSPQELVRPDYMVEINVTVHNYGSGEGREGCSATTYCNDTFIGEESTEVGLGLLSDRNVTWTFDLDTTGFAGGMYIIRANASSMYLGDNDLTNNELTTTLTIRVPPVASFEYSPMSPEVGETVTFDATASYDPDGGDIVSYDWDFGDEATGAGDTATHAYDSAGTYTVNLTVTDDESQTNSISTGITVREVGAPLASFTSTPSEPLVGELVTFNASASEPDGGTIVSYAWDFGDDTTKIYREANLTAITNHTYTEAKTYTVMLNITDDEGKWGNTSQSITVYAPPVANFTYSPSEPVVDDPVTFNATASYDPDGGNATYPSGIVSYTWDFGDDGTGSGDIAEHTYADAGEYIVTLTVTDDEGITNDTTATVTVSAQLVHNVAVTDVTPSPTVAAPGQYVSVTVAVENTGDFAETFNVTAYYDTNPIGTETVALDPDAAGSPTITWDTTFVAEGVYTISANASVVDGETYTADNTYTDDTVTVRRTVGPGQLLSIEFSGEREYLEDEDVKIRLVALVRYADTMEPASNATANITIYDPDGTLWVSSNMIERLAETGIYEWESSDTIVELELEKGFYLIHVVTSRGALEASEISQFHIAPVQKMSSIISLDADPLSVTAGSSITLSGAITPKRARVTVTILYRPEGGNWSELRSIKTSTTSHYSVGWVMTTAGTYEVKASWLGDLRTEGAESEVKTVTVRPTGSLSLDLPPYILVGAAAIVGSLVGSVMGSMMVIRLRKPKPA